MEQPHELIANIREQLRIAKRVLVVSHLRPDGDAIGSELAIGLALIESGKVVQMVLSDGITENFRFLAGSDLVTTSPNGQFDYIIVVDSSEIERTDTVLSGYGVPDLNIDHHKTNTYFARVNLVEEEAVATAEILAKYMPDFGLKISPPVANALLAGIITDTIGFRTVNVYPDVLRLVADLMVRGGELADIYFRTIVEQSFEAARYWGAGLSKLNMEDGLVWTTLTLEDRQNAGYPSRDDADLIKILSAIQGARVAVILTEQPSGYVKISWRLCGSLPTDLDVSEIALRFGGGGHKAAAGADVKGNLSQVLGEVLSSTRLSMNPVIKPLVENG
ncbi:MAG: DHH family phosphoesterase [Acidobacteriaceae bacterium]